MTQHFLWRSQTVRTQHPRALSVPHEVASEAADHQSRFMPDRQFSGVHTFIVPLLKTVEYQWRLTNN